MTHGSKIVDFVRLNLGDDGDEICGIAQVTIVKEQLDTGLVTILVDVIDTSSVETRGTTDDTVNLRCVESITTKQDEIYFVRGLIQ